MFRPSLSALYRGKRINVRPSLLEKIADFPCVRKLDSSSQHVYNGRGAIEQLSKSSWESMCDEGNWFIMIDWLCYREPSISVRSFDHLDADVTFMVMVMRSVKFMCLRDKL